MFETIRRRFIGLAGAFLAAQAGSIMIYTGAFMAIGVGGAALSIDVGRIVLLRTQTQNRADAGALAGAAQLDAQNGAMERSDIVVRDSMVAYTTAGAGTQELTVLAVNFFPAMLNGIDRDTVTPATDATARFVEVILEQRTISFFYGPATALLKGAAAGNTATIQARAVAMSDPYICKMQPLMMCNPYEGQADSLSDYPGIGVRIKQSGQSGATSGNFGLLDLPSDISYPGANGANAVMAALSAEDPLGCYAVSALGTAPGNKTSATKAGVNVRFGKDDTDMSVKPAPNVMNYKPDRIMDSITPDPLYDPSDPSFGDGVWDLAGYWSQNHAGVTMPSDLAGASRYQIYLFELGVHFWRKPSGKRTKFTLNPEDVGGGWVEIYPEKYGLTSPMIPVNATTPHDNWVDGVPNQPPSTQGQARRLMRTAVVNCGANPPQGNTTVPATGEFIEFFLTQAAGTSGNGATIYGEIVRGVEMTTSFEFHGNVRLVE